MGDGVAVAHDVSHVTKLRSYKRVLGPSPHVFKSLPTSCRVIYRFCNYNGSLNRPKIFQLEDPREWSQMYSRASRMRGLQRSWKTKLNAWGMDDVHGYAKW